MKILIVEILKAKILKNAIFVGERKSYIRKLEG
jgi:hypothetical protein